MTRLWQTQNVLDPMVEAYTVGDDYLLDRRLLPFEVVGSIAHAAGLVRIGILTPADFRSVRDALADLLAHPETFTVEREQEDIHTAVEQHLTARLGAVGARVHTGRSRNDQVQTDLRLFIKDRLLELHGLVGEAAAAWERFGRGHDDVRMPGYTHLQRAMPTTIGHWAASHAEAFLDNCRSLRAAYDEVNASPLGSAAGYGVPLPLDRDYTAALMGFARVQRNTLRVQSARPRVEAATVATLALLARDIGVLAEDVVLFATAEFGYLKLDETFTTGSSIMPQKRNPDVVELTRARAALFPGWLQQVLAVGARASGYHRDYQMTKGPLFQALDEAQRMTQMMGLLPARLEVNADRCRSHVTSELLATQQALALARSGVPFRDAYRTVAEGARGGTGLAAAEAAQLPDYAGAPGNPAWDLLAQERTACMTWSEAERASLKHTWDALLTLNVDA